MKPLAGQTITFIGSGNVATHLAVGLKKAGMVIDTVWSPDKNNRNKLADLLQTNAVHSIEELSLNSDFYIIAVPDDKIAEVVNALPQVNGIIAHTSGITTLSSISARFANSGVFYPLQTFSISKEVNLKEVPFCIEGNNDDACQQLYHLAQTISNKVYKISSEERKKLHLAAVFVSNFVNHLYHSAEDILNSNNLSFELLKPLIEEVATKVMNLSPANAQTGPARRKDSKTISIHEEMLKHHPDYLKLYELITRQISKRYEL